MTFKEYLTQKENRIWIYGALIIGIIYFMILRFLYPLPSFYADSFTWLGAANTGQPVTMRPIGYSKLLIFFKHFSRSDIALIAAQFLTNLLVNLLLFFTCNYLFSLKNTLKTLLFGLLILNPFYLFYSNYVSSDPFFNCLAVLWFTLLIWILHKPSWFLVISQVIVLAGLFELRYNAIIFPVISAIALALSQLTVRKKIISIALNLLSMGAIIFFTTYVNYKFTGVKTFSAFSGWQLANNALHVMRHDTINTTAIEDLEVRDFAMYAKNFFDTTTQWFPDSSASAFFMWYFNSPLKKYMYVYKGRSRSYFKTWNALGPVYNKFGKTIIFQRPITYFQHFVIPNSRAYFLPPLEMYETYMENRDTIAAVATKYYGYTSTKTPEHHPTIYSAVFIPTQYLFTIANFLFIALGLYYVISGAYRYQKLLFNQTLLCFTILFLANFGFIVLLAPSVIRYHIYILTLALPFLVCLCQSIYVRKATG